MKIVEKYPVTFIHGDNMEFMRECREKMMWKHFHMGIVDPPYGIEVTTLNLGSTKDSKPKNYERGDWDSKPPEQEYWNLLWYLCRNIIVWGGNYFTSNFGRVTDLRSGEMTGIPNGRCFYVWDKYDRGKSFADGELALTTIDKNSRVIQQGRTKRGSNDGDKRHDTQKPVYLYDFIHIDNDLRGKKVLDTHGGSHTHAIAAYINNVKLTIIEKQESFHLSGIKAYEDASRKGRLIF